LFDVAVIIQCVVLLTKTCKVSLAAMAEDEALRANVRHLFDKLPKQSALRRPLIRVLLDGLSQDEVRSLGLPIKESTIKRYRNEECDLSPLFLKRSRVAGAVNTAFVKREEAATDWVVAQCGITQSGRVRTVFKTEMSFNQLFQRYQDNNAKDDQVSVNIFARVAKQLHVHFGVGAVDTMTCINCREWAAKLEELGDEMLLDVSNRRRQNLQKQHDDLSARLHEHQEALVRQRRAWLSDLEDVRKNEGLVLCVLDFSTFELMDRKTTSVFCVVVIDNVDGELVRRYYDFVDVHLSGRKRDVVYFALTLLYDRNVFASGRRVRLWSDAGSGDFRNAPCLYSCLQLNTVCSGVVFEGFNFFGARHGWNDCDRHFGTGKQALSRWLVEKASCNNSLTLDVKRCAEILAGLHNTAAFVSTKASIWGTDHPPVKNLTKHYCFRFVDDATAHMAMFSDEKVTESVSFPNGQMMPPEEAKQSARARKKSKK
jgi:hypothetical protein